MLQLLYMCPYSIDAGHGPTVYYSRWTKAPDHFRLFEQETVNSRELYYRLPYPGWPPWPQPKRSETMLSKHASLPLYFPYFSPGFYNNSTCVDLLLYCTSSYIFLSRTHGCQLMSSPVNYDVCAGVINFACIWIGCCYVWQEKIL